MQRAVTKLCFDGIKFSYNPKDIPRNVGPKVTGCIGDFYNQYYTWRRLVEALSKVNIEKMVLPKGRS